MNGNGLVHDLERTSARWPAATAAKVDRFVKDRVGEAAAIQSRKVVAAAHAELGNRALRRFVELLYDETPDGLLCNVGDGGRVIIPAPWSRTRHAAYGLTDHSRRVLRAVLMVKLERMPAAYRLLECDGKHWYLNLDSFGNVGAALGWLKRNTITADLWLKHNDAMPRRGRNARRNGR